MNFVHRSYNGPYRNSPEHKGSSQRNCSRGPPVSPGLDFEDESHSKYVSDVGRNKNYETPEDSEVSEQKLDGFPRKSIFICINNMHKFKYFIEPKLVNHRQFAPISDVLEMCYCQL